MKSLQIFTLGLGVVAATFSFAEDKTPSENPVIVTYDQPEKLTDFNSTGFGSVTESDIKYLTEYFTEHIKRIAKQYLSTGEHLEIVIQDIDLAGQFEPEHGPNLQNVRIFRDITFPRMKLTFRYLGSDGQVLVEGARKLINMNYNMDIRPPLGDTEFRYDKALLTDWIRSEFKKKKS